MATEAQSATSELPKPTADALEVPLAGISVGKNLREPDPELLKELVQSIEQLGVLEPVLVRRKGEQLELVAGFRRVAAAKKAKLLTIPARVMDVTDEELAEVQLTENLQREDLSELDEARAFKAYVDAGHSQVDLAKRLGKSQPYVANRLRLLPLPKQVHKLLEGGELTASHAEVLAQVPKEADEKGEYVAKTAARAAKQGTSVSELHRQVSRDVANWREQVALAKQFEKAKAPVCPTCKKPPTEKGYGEMVGHGDYSSAHQWNPTTGKTEADRRREENERWSKQRAGGSSSAASRPRPKPVDCRESPLLRSGHDPLAIATAILKEVGVSRVQLLEYDTRGWTGGSVLRIGIEGRPLGDVHVIARPVPYSSGERTQFVVQDQKASDRKASKSKVQTWERKALAATKLRPGKTATFDSAQLKGIAGLVTSRLAKIRDKPELLELARQSEADGKHRAVILDYIDEQLLGRGHDSWSSVNERRL